MSESKYVTLGRVIRKVICKEVTFKQKCGSECREMETAKGTACTKAVG